MRFFYKLIKNFYLLEFSTNKIQSIILSSFNKRKNKFIIFKNVVNTIKYLHAVNFLYNLSEIINLYLIRES